MKASDFHLDDDQLDHIFDRPADHPDRSLTVREFAFAPYASGLDEPTLVLVGGQPAAGKSRAIARATRGRANEMVPLSGDDLRPFHPDFERLSRDHPWLMPNATAQASGAWVRRCIDHAVEHRHSLLLEGVFRNPLTVVQTIDRFAGAGYGVEVVGLAVPYRDSLLAGLDRFLHPGDGEVARWTPATAHDGAYRMIPATLQAAEDTEGTGRIHVTNRAAQDLHTSIRTPAGEWDVPNPGAAAVAAKRARDAPPSQETARTWLQLYTDHTGELARRGQITETTLPTVQQLQEQAAQLLPVAYPHEASTQHQVHEHGRQVLSALDQGPTEIAAPHLLDTGTPASSPPSSARDQALNAGRPKQRGPRAGPPPSKQPPHRPPGPGHTPNQGPHLG